MWYESNRGDVSQSTSPSSTRSSAARSRVRYGASAASRARHAAGERARLLVQLVQPVDERPVVFDVGVVVRDVARPDLPVVADAQQVGVERQEAFVADREGGFGLAPGGAARPHRVGVAALGGDHHHGALAHRVTPLDQRVEVPGVDVADLPAQAQVVQERPQRVVERRTVEPHRPEPSFRCPAGGAAGTLQAVPELLTSDGARLHYVRSGPDDAPRAVLLHGLGSDAAGYDALVTAIGERVEVARIDLRGHGRSEPLTDPERYGWFGRAAADVVEVMDDLGWDDAAVAGGSLGAATAVAVALGYPERVRRLGVIAPAFAAGEGGGNDAAQGLFALVQAGGFASVLDVLESLPEPPPAALLDEARANWGRQDDAAMRACVTALSDAVLLDDIADLARSTCLRS